jgi:AAA+ superfamily predicted ATPase
MARADILISLVKSVTAGDLTSFTKTVNALIADEREKKHHIIADKLTSSLQNNSVSNNNSVFKTSNSYDDLLIELTPQRSINSLILDEHIFKVCNELIEEQHRAELLRSYGMEPRHRILFAGSPGNGKTSLAEAIANELMCPIYTVRYENLIGSYLGETATRLLKIFDFIKTQRCVLFFDEFDTIGKERGDTKETGEIKRVVSSLLLQMDKLPSYVVVITASNHPELLDRAVWRRFQLKLELKKPNKKQILQYIAEASDRTNIKIIGNKQTIANQLEGLSFSEIEEFCLDIFRQSILQRKQDNTKSIVDNTLAIWKEKFKL